jgi:hypothetical protein
MPVKLGRNGLRSTVAIAAAASVALKVAKENAPASCPKEAGANGHFSVMKTASLKALGDQAAHLQRRRTPKDGIETEDD